MRFGDYAKQYNELFPRVEPKLNRVVDTPLGKKDIEEEHKEEIIDSKVELEETPEEVEEV